MKKVISILLIVAVSHALYAGVGDKAAKPSKENKTITDTVPFAIDEEEIMDYNDSLTSFPAYELYCSWDTANIHSKKFDISSLKDSVKEIVLADKYNCGYVPPFIGNVTSGFGPRRKIFHYGIDLDLETGDAVGAAFDGKVRIAKKSKSYGNVIVIRHSNGIETYYAHLSKINVEVGQEVYAGENIGLGGNTGRSRGSHLHFELRYLGQPINPTDVISFSEHKLISDTLALSKKTFDYMTAAKKIASAKGGKGSKIHVVKKGDTLSAIARKYGTSTKVLCQKNKLKTTSKLRLGQQIKL